ncbi:large subunit ribosomal protein L11 [Puccinia sorghi]|uniref:Large subunit ribosomal protein L11 n=1 Tax=Puccinia sorghi TaxID=27349 RepID=A0A0L6UPM7_9BASI|nr:large subunit ribosomal protein L11 [Puccinia sorghi]
MVGFGFCKLFNAQTSHIEPSIPIRVNMSINGKDKSYKFKLNSPPTTYFIKKHLNASSSNPSSSSSSSSAKKSSTDTKSHSFIGSELSLKFIYHLALLKKSVDHEDLNHIPLESLTRSIAAQVKNMGIKLVP